MAHALFLPDIAVSYGLIEFRVLKFIQTKAWVNTYCPETDHNLPISTLK